MGILIPSKHGVDGLRQLRRARLVDAAGVHPEVVQSVALRLLSAEQDLLVAWLTMAPLLRHILESHLLAIGPPGMRQYRVWWDIVGKVGS